MLGGKARASAPSPPARSHPLFLEPERSLGRGGWDQPSPASTSENLPGKKRSGRGLRGGVHSWAGPIPGWSLRGGPKGAEPIPGRGLRGGLCSWVEPKGGSYSWVGPRGRGLFLDRGAEARAEAG